MFAAAVASVDPDRCVSDSLRSATPGSRTHIIALGKAAVPMAGAAERWLRTLGIRPAGGLVVSHAERAESSELPLCFGDHPTPGARSLAASRQLADCVDRVRRGDEVLVLLSGGATSLIAAPNDVVPCADRGALFSALLASGLPIDDVNVIRRRVLRWAGGGLAAALPGVSIRALVISDVPENAVHLVGSGPVSPTTASEDYAAAVDRFRRSGLAPEWLPDTAPATPPVPIRRDISISVIASNQTAQAAAARAARAKGYRVSALPGTLRGDAAEAGKWIATKAQAAMADGEVWILGGETVVALPAGAPSGGRSQHLALAALDSMRPAPAIVVLAAGTDGRDGTTDYAGALVLAPPANEHPGTTFTAALQRAEAHTVLASHRSLIRTGPTLTNVGDLVIIGRAQG